ncbi:hypothetical protein GE061_002400 [Apolygus lucorum]|uniref:SP-RING-type domain-containing protein n=1 Tax=Apolygus lucorum TaxID=248454 RepID=A0A8S9X4N4_APOLU|nr:hypothetical protein GE061_002400 [Apolygus lucorum]
MVAVGTLRSSVFKALISTLLIGKSPRVMSRSSVKESSFAIPELLQDPLVKGNFLKLSTALITGINYDFVSHLVPVTLLSQQSGSYDFKIKLEVGEANILGNGREKVIRDDGSEHIHYNFRVLIRMCKLVEGKAKIDCFPSNMSVRVNGVFYMRNDSEPAGPIDITTHMKLSPHVENVVIVDQPNPLGLFVVAIILVKARNCSSLVKHLIQNRTRPANVTKEKIQAYHEGLHGCDVAVTSTEFSLTCPLSRKRFVVPAQGENCNHLGCFDLHVYLKLNAHTRRWLCPVCNTKVLPTQLIVEGYWMEVLGQLEPHTNVVYLDSKGSWSPKKSDPIVGRAEEVTVPSIELE